ncbi:hypothetical protein TNCV_2776521 [Trichonephila clavipes]|nr:hypothetical protein TNCV_2776521 [Trichonephila clavipes]
MGFVEINFRDRLDETLNVHRTTTERRFVNLGFTRRMLPNSTNKFIEVIVGSMETTNDHGTWGRKPRLVGVICKNRYEDCDIEWNKNGQ